MVLKLRVQSVLVEQWSVHKCDHIAVKKVHLKSTNVIVNMGDPVIYVMICANNKKEL